MTEFDSIVTKLQTTHEVTNPRVLANLDILTCLKKGCLVVDTEDYRAVGAVKFLNRKGLLKYKKGKEENKLVVYPTLLFYYLTLIMKYDIYDTYSESIKLYHAVGEKLNDVKYL